MKVFFIHCPKKIYDDGKLYQMQVMLPPIGLWSLADMVQSAGHEVEIVHTGIEECADQGFDLADYLVSRGAECVCFSLHWHLQLSEVLQQSISVRQQLPEAIILLGGITASGMASEIIEQWRHIDYIVCGEGEAGLASLLAGGRAAASSAPGLCRRDEDGRAVTNPHAPCPDGLMLDRFSHIRLELMKNHRLYRGRYFFTPAAEDFDIWSNSNRMWYLYVGRGCTFDCAYCGGGRRSHNLLSGRSKVVFRPGSSVAADMMSLNRNHDVNSFYICFNPSGMPRSYYPALFDSVRGKMDASMVFEYYNPTVAPDFIRSFSRAFSHETSQFVLSPTAFAKSARARYCPSAFDDSTLHDMIELSSREGIRVVLFYSPMPQEDEPERLAGMRFARTLVEKFPGVSVIVMPIEIEPLSPWALDPAASGITPLRTTLSEYVTHHSIGSRIISQENLGYRFPHFEDIMQTIAGFSDNPRWMVFFPHIFDSH